MPDEKRLGAKPENTSCLKARRLWDGYKQAKADGKNRYRMKKLDAWAAKWQGRLEACDEEDAMIGEAGEELQSAMAALEVEERVPGFLTVFTQPGGWVWGVGLVLLVVIGVVLVWFLLTSGGSAGSAGAISAGGDLGGDPNARDPFDGWDDLLRETE